MIELEFKPVQVHSVMMNTAGMYVEYKPVEILRRYIYCYWVSYRHNNIELNIEHSSKNEMIAPDGCIDVLIGADVDGDVIRNIIVGTVDKPLFVDMEYEKIHTFGIRFLPGGLQAFIRESACLFTNRIESLKDVCSIMNNELGNKILSSRNIKDIIDITNRYFIKKFSNDIPWEDTFQNALHLICKTKGSMSVKEIARKEAVSEKQLTRIFYERTGVSTKLFTRIIRFQNILSIINNRHDIKLVDIAMKNGYYDQAHLIHDFKDFCGKTPSEYMME